MFFSYQKSQVLLFPDIQSVKLLSIVHHRVILPEPIRDEY